MEPGNKSLNKNYLLKIYKKKFKKWPQYMCGFKLKKCLYLKLVNIYGNIRNIL